MRSHVFKVLVSILALTMLCSCASSKTITHKRLVDEYEKSPVEASYKRSGASNSEMVMQLDVIDRPFYSYYPQLALCATGTVLLMNYGIWLTCPLYVGFESPYREYTNVFNADNSVKEVVESEIKITLKYDKPISKQHVIIMEQLYNKVVSFIKSNPDYEPIMSYLKNMQLKHDSFQSIAYETQFHSIDNMFSTNNLVTEAEFNQIITYQEREKITDILIGYYKSTRKPDGTLNYEIRRKASSKFDDNGPLLALKNIALE